MASNGRAGSIPASSTARGCSTFCWPALLAFRSRDRSSCSGSADLSSPVVNEQSCVATLNIACQSSAQTSLASAYQSIFKTYGLFCPFSLCSVCSCLQRTFDPVLGYRREPESTARGCSTFCWPALLAFRSRDRSSCSGSADLSFAVVL